ncbi:MAG: transglycosylase domain-containing protein, partial [Clostridia bacterium]|nr:transglycosylase domain-containing protein [Clostridia bacterium]
MRKIIKRVIIGALLSIVIIALAAGLKVVAKGYAKYKAAIGETPLSEAVAAVREKETFAPYEEIPQDFFNAVVAVEDRRFYSHNGFDIIGVARAFVTNVTSGEVKEGGSTITQQLAKNLYFPLDSTIERKVAEVFMALEIEKNYFKNEILELYANAIYYGSGYYTIREASEGYFGKEPIEMTFDECTLLAGIPNAPSVYSLDVNPDLARQRQEKVIECMVEAGYVV